jgi:hypothetical protein
MATTFRSLGKYHIQITPSFRRMYLGIELIYLGAVCWSWLGWVATASGCDI